MWLSFQYNMTYISETELTVRYAETDMMGIVHHSRYYPWFEIARGEFIKKIGLTYSEMENMGILLPLTETHCKYIQGLTYEDEVIVTCRIEKLSVARISFLYEVIRKKDMKKVSEGKTVHGFVDKNMRPINMKKDYSDLWDKMAELM